MKKYKCPACNDKKFVATMKNGGMGWTPCRACSAEIKKPPHENEAGILAAIAAFKAVSFEWPLDPARWLEDKARKDNWIE